MDFPIYTLDTAPEASKAALAQAATFGFIPNLEAFFAQAPALLQGSMALWDLFETTSLRLLSSRSSISLLIMNTTVITAWRRIRV